MAISDETLMDQAFRVMAKFRRETAGGGHHHKHDQENPETGAPDEAPPQCGHDGHLFGPPGPPPFGPGHLFGPPGPPPFGPGGPHGHHPHGPFAHMWRDRVLQSLVDNEGIPQKQLAEKLDIRPQSISGVLKKLEAHGMITREVNPDDKRESRVSLTEQGKERAARAKEAQSRVAARFFGALSMEEKEQLSVILTKILDADTPEESSAE